MEPGTDPLEPLACVSCGYAIADSETFCAVSDDDVLCWECALARGGTYDAATDRWTKMPDASGLFAARPTHRSHAG